MCLGWGILTIGSGGVVSLGLCEDGVDCFCDLAAAGSITGIDSANLDHCYDFEADPIATACSQVGVDASVAITDPADCRDTSDGPLTDDYWARIVDAGSASYMQFNEASAWCSESGSDDECQIMFEFELVSDDDNTACDTVDFVDIYHNSGATAGPRISFYCNQTGAEDMGVGGLGGSDTELNFDFVHGTAYVICMKLNYLAEPEEFILAVDPEGDYTCAGATAGPTTPRARSDPYGDIDGIRFSDANDHFEYVIDNIVLCGGGDGCDTP